MRKTDVLKSDLKTTIKYLTWALEKAKETEKDLDLTYSTNTMIRIRNLIEYTEQAYNAALRLR